MKNILKKIFTCIILGFSFISCSKEVSQIPEDYKKVEINKIIDGDTIKVSINGKLENIRLLLVDAPEIKQDHPYSKEAKYFVEERLSDDDYIYVEQDVEKKDKYGRILGYVHHMDNGELKMLNKELVEEGFARVGYIYDSKKHLDMLNNSQEIAKNKGLNIWSREGYVTNRGYNP